MIVRLVEPLPTPMRLCWPRRRDGRRRAYCPYLPLKSLHRLKPFTTNVLQDA